MQKGKSLGRGRIAGILVLSFALQLLPPIAAQSHNPHGDCTHAYSSPRDVIQGTSAVDRCNGLQFDGALMYGYGSGDDLEGLGGSDKIYGLGGDDDVNGDSGDDYLYDDDSSHYDSDDICDGTGTDEISVTDEPVCCYPVDFIFRVNDGVPNEPTAKDPWDEIFYIDTNVCAPT